MFPVERPNTLHMLARGARGRPVPPGSVSIHGLLDEHALDKIAESTGKRIWNKFMSFGAASAGLLGIFIVVRIVKLIIDTLIHGYALHTVYGWSLHLVGAIWDSVTNLLLHLERDQKPKTLPDAVSNNRETTPNAPPEATPSTTSQPTTSTDYPSTVPGPSQLHSYQQPSTSFFYDQEQANNKVKCYQELRKLLTAKRNDLSNTDDA